MRRRRKGRDARVYSSELERFLKAIKQCQSDYHFHYEVVGKKDKEKCDLEHELELAKKYKDRVKAAPKLSKVLKERRVSKDIVENTEHIVRFVDENQKLFNNLKQLLGQVRKTERSHHGRVYKARVRDDLTI